MNQHLFDYIAASPTAYHAVSHTAAMLRGQGYRELCESDSWELTAGEHYFVTRNGSSLIAFRMPNSDFSGFMMTATHSDSPCFKIKENAEISDSHYVRLSTEKYGGMLCASWMDRPLSIAGRITVRTENGIAVKLVDLAAPTVIIPNVAIHMNRNANDGMSYNPAADMLPLVGTDCQKNALRPRIAESVGISENDILATDLFVYNPEKGVEWNDLIAAPRLDDLQCAFSALTAFLQADNAQNCPVYCLFDNEEVGSQTKQGAASTFLTDVLERIVPDSTEYRRKIANSFLVSADNAHAVHPNHPEYADKNHSVFVNHGVVIKYNANQKYTTDAISASIFRLVCEKAKIPFQFYTNRADMAGGSTLGNIANTQVSLNTVDIGLAQLAMHSAYETAGAEDTRHMVNALKSFYETTLTMKTDGSYELK